MSLRSYIKSHIGGVAQNAIYQLVKWVEIDNQRYHVILTSVYTLKTGDKWKPLSTPSKQHVPLLSGISI